MITKTKTKKKVAFDIPKWETEQLDFGYVVWKDIPEDQTLSSKNIGCRVWVAGESDKKERVLKAVHVAGEKYWPEGGYEVLELDRNRVRSYTPRCVRLHFAQ